jgi:hypothetical protein
MTKTTGVIAALFLMASLATLAFAQRHITDDYLGAARLVVGNSNVVNTYAAHGTLSIASGATTNTLTLTNLAATDTLVGSINSGNSNDVTIKTIAATAGTVTVTLTGAPGATTQISVIALRGE